MHVELDPFPLVRGGCGGQIGARHAATLWRSHDPVVGDRVDEVNLGWELVR